MRTSPTRVLCFCSTTLPTHKKIPMLVHQGKPNAESWFSAKFAQDMSSVICRVFPTVGEEQERAIKESLEMLRTIEEHGLGENKFFGGEDIRSPDLAFGGIAHWLAVIDDTVGVKLVEPHTFPRSNVQMKDFTDVDFKDFPVIKENLPDPDEMLVFFKRSKERILARLASA